MSDNLQDGYIRINLLGPVTSSENPRAEAMRLSFLKFSNRSGSALHSRKRSPRKIDYASACSQLLACCSSGALGSHRHDC